MKLLSILLFALIPANAVFAQTNTFPASGWVGIGTTSPQQHLDVTGNIRVSNSLMTNLGSLDWGNLHWQLTTNNALRFALGLQMNETGSNNGGNFSIWRYQDNGEYLGTALAIKRSNGFTGLNTNNPQADFQIGERFTFMDGGWKGISNNVMWSPTLNTNVRIGAAPASVMYFTEKGNITFLSAPTGTAGSTMNGGIYSLVIHNSGQVGIGTSYDVTSFPDQSSKLFVEGGIKARKIKVDQTTWPDYVFNKGYNLPSLDSIENYILAHHHLPEISSADSVKVNGVDLGDNQAALLKKIEELTLYIIEQHKISQEQHQRLKQQSERQEVLENTLKDLEDRINRMEMGQKITLTDQKR